MDKFKGKFSLKIEQRAALEAFVAVKDVFAMLPTGFGKSLIYKLAPLVAKSIGLCADAVVGHVAFDRTDSFFEYQY